MNDGIASLGRVALTATVAVSCVAAVALGLERLFRQGAPPLRAAILRVALVKFALPGPGLALLPTWGAFGGVASATASASPWWVAALAVWVAGASVALIRAMLALRTLRCLVADSAPADGAATARLAALAAEIGTRTPRLRISTEIAAPFACGSARPTIVLPADWSARKPGGCLDAILLHELAHVKRGDLPWRVLTSLVAVVWWWHPLFHIVAARASAAQEDACDDLAVATLRGTADDYGQALVTAAARAARAEAPALAVGLGAERIERRLRRLADPLRRAALRLTPAQRAVILGLAFAAALLPGHGNGAHAGAGGVTDSERADDAHAGTHHHRHQHSHHGHP